MSNTRKITIKNGYSDGTLQLSDKGHTRADKKDFICWSIKKNIDVTSIEEIKKKSGPDIFKTGPHPNGDEWSAEIDHDAPDNAVYEYRIEWNGTWGHQVCDPKISIRPSEFNFIKLFTCITLGLFGLLSLIFVRRQMNKK